MTSKAYNKTMASNPSEPIEVNPENIKLATPTLAYDGLWVRIHPNNTGELIFYRNLNDDIHNLKGETVSIVRFDSLEELKSIREQINETIKMHENREP